MNKLKYIAAAVMLTAMASSCKVNDIDFYSEDEDARLEFEGPTSCTFSDEDYLHANIIGDEQYSEASFTAQMIGYLLESPRTYVLSSEPIASAFAPEFQFSNPYTFPAAAASSEAHFQVKCPGRSDVSTRLTTNTGQAYLVYDEDAAEHQFGQGRVENIKARVDVVLQIYPTDWTSSFWGSYSTSKYILMMETFRAVHKDIAQTAESKDLILQAYEAYKAANGALYGDDDASQTEISFPR